MIKLNTRKLFARVAICLLPVLFHTPGYAECTSDDAHNRGLAIQKWSTDYQTKMSITLQETPTKYNAMVDFMDEVNTIQDPIGRLLAAGKYNEVCNQYDELEKLIGVKLNPQDAGTMTMEQFNAGLNRADKTQGCDMVQFIERMLATAQSYEAKFANGEITDAQKEAISIELGPVQSMVTQDPTLACQQLEQVKQKWGL